jgi:hypothetical protein
METQMLARLIGLSVVLEPLLWLSVFEAQEFWTSY